MKNKSIQLMMSAMAIGAMLFTTSCRKNNEFKDEDGQASEDNRNVQSQADQGISDANTAIGNYSAMMGKATQPLPSVLANICGASIDTAGMSTGTIKINYDGTVCNNRKREGSIRLTILNYVNGVRWKDAGCVLKVEYLSYKVTRASDDKSIQFDGIHLVTNVSGGTWWDLYIAAQPNLIHAVNASGALNCKFDDGSTATCNINRQFTYTWANNVLTCKGEGTGSNNGLSSLENYGTTRHGDAFTSAVTVPIIWNTTCGAWAPVQGNVDIKVDGKEFNLICTFGVDAGGNPMPIVANDCPYGWKVYWKYKKKDKTKIFKYL